MNTFMLTALSIHLLSATPAAEPHPPLLVVASGDCRSAELRTVARSLQGTLQPSGKQMPDSTADALLQQFLPMPTKSLEEIQRQFEAARANFYDGELAKAESQLALAQRALEQLPPSPERWRTSVDIRLVRYLTFQAQRRTDAALQAFAEVLRLDPRRELDPDYYSPGTRAAFEKVRKQLASVRRGKLLVTSSPPGADVFLDGRHVGKTPLSADFIPGTYPLQIMKDGALSFTRSVQVQADRSVAASVDLGFEGMVQAGPPPCVRTRPDEADPLRGVAKLSAMLGVGEVVVVRLVRGTTGPAMVSAALLNVETGQQVREGSLKLTNAGDIETGKDDLIAFIQTGKVSKEIVVASAPPPREPVEEASIAASAPRVSSAPPVTSPLPVQGGSWRPGARLGSYVAAGLGAASFVGAGVVWASSREDVATMSRRTAGRALRANDGPGRDLYQSLRSRSQLITGLLVGGGIGVAGGAALFFLSGPSSPPRAVTVMPTGDGASIQVRGSF
jgi:PEGA domain